MTECEELRASMTALEVFEGERELPASLASHVARCADCRAYVAEMAKLERALRRTASLPLPPGFLEHLRGIPRRQRDMVRARNRVLLPAALAASLSLATPLAGGEAALWLSSLMTLAGAFAAVAGMTRVLLIPD